MKLCLQRLVFLQIAHVLIANVFSYCSWIITEVELYSLDVSCIFKPYTLKELSLYVNFVTRHQAVPLQLLV